MTTEVTIGYGTLFATGNGATPEVFTTLAEVTSITPPNFARDSIDASHGQSPGAMREFIAGMTDPGEVSIEMNFVPGNAAADALADELALTPATATKNRRITFPDGTTWDFPAFLTAFEPDAPLDDKMTASATFKVAGAVTIVQA